MSRPESPTRPMAIRRAVDQSRPTPIAVVGAETRPVAHTRLDDLTARERKVLSLLAQGLTDRGIGESLWLTPKTVETHVHHMLAKLNLPTGGRHNRRVLAVLSYHRLDTSAGTDPESRLLASAWSPPGARRHDVCSEVCLTS